MKYTRLEIRRSISNSKLNLIVEFFLIIPIIAIVSGSIITKVFIAPYAIKNTNAPVDTVVPVNLSIKSNIKGEYSLFILQAGAFVSKKNADVLQNGIKSKGTNAFVIKDIDVFRVIIDISQDKNILTETKDKLKLEGYECLINVLNFKNTYGNETGEEAAIMDYIDSVMNMLAVEIELKENIGKINNIDIDEFNSSVLNVSEKYKKVSETYTNTKLAPVITAFNEKLTKTMENFKISFEKNDANSCQQDAAEQAIMFNGFYKNIIQTFVK